MCNSRHRNAFTLIEVLIVVIIMAVLAATIIPQFTTSAKDAKDASLKFNMHTLRSQIELYKSQHDGTLPAITDNSLPQLTSATNNHGTIGAAGTTYPFGPYVDVIPNNPFDGSNKVTAVATSGAKPTGPAGALGGWQYDATNGAVWPNCATTEFDYTKL